MKWTNVLSCLAVALLVALCAAPAIAQVDWDAGGGSDHRWFLDLNWSGNTLPALGDVTKEVNGTTTGALERIVYQERPDQNSLFVDPGIGSFRASAPSGGTYTFRFTRFGTTANALTTTGTNGNADFWHDGAGTYIIQIDALSELRAGDPEGLFAPNFAPINADLYGFKLDLRGTYDVLQDDNSPAVVWVTRKLGAGPLQLFGEANLNRSAIVTAGVHGIQNLDDFPGTIDCAFDGSTNGVDPVTVSPWRVGDNGTTGHARLIVKAGSVVNVGDWDLASTNFVPHQGEVLVYVYEEATLETAKFAMYETDARLRLEHGWLTIQRFSPEANVPPRALWLGNSELVHTLVKFLPTPPAQSTAVNRITIVGSGGVQAPPDALLQFAPDARLRPESYDPGDIVIGSLRLEVTNTGVDIQTRVAQEPGLLFDGSFTSIHAGGADSTLEANTPDVCNVIFRDFINAASGEECLPSFNRCTKYWHDIDGETLTIVDNTVNHNADYTPSNYPAEAVYGCKTEADFVLAGHRVYGIGVLNGAIMLASTRYGDFDVDKDVDLFNFARFQNSFTGNTSTSSSAHASWFPLADYATDPTTSGQAPYVGQDPVSNPADCDVDLVDFVFFRARWHETVDDEVFVCGDVPSTSNVVCGGPIHSAAGLALNCPNCELRGVGCGDSGTGCTYRCPWVSGGPDNPNGIFDIGVYDGANCMYCISVAPGATVDYVITGTLLNDQNTAWRCGALT